MTGTLSKPETSQMACAPDTSLLAAAREIAPMIREHSADAEPERRLSQPVLKALRETGLLRMTTLRLLGGVGDRPRHPRPRGRGDRSPRLCRGVDLGEPAGLGIPLLPSSRRESRGDLPRRTGHPHRRPVRPPPEGDVDERRLSHRWSSPVRQQLSSGLVRALGIGASCLRLPPRVRDAHDPGAGAARRGGPTPRSQRGNAGVDVHRRDGWRRRRGEHAHRRGAGVDPGPHRRRD
jgi:hypothetical protein